ncbi:extracellular signal-regulated kinase 2-like isoform X2 [Aphidius gifuensis]|uniref:extracellular signal-regulated kinase 2-like isoform X2 n=1 Tax=Aphidius gifuensis TaxID=684658 RepID=UPI001CDCB668|nr:extracellular signal-regulated kinase 2-like isoform X2 [Aphidius gifuensis]
MSGKSHEKLGEIDSHVTKQYNIIRRLGKGAYGIVWKAVDRKSHETVAVKKIFDAFRNQTDAQRTFREIMFLLSLSNHENIIQLIGLHKADNDRDIYLIFEFMETDLHNVIKKRNILKDIHKVFIMYQLFKAIKYIHSGNVIHRDLKPSNILLNAQCHCKIADFGLARSVTQITDGVGETGCDPTLTDYVATRWYRAPEILIASKKYTKGIDMWSLGCILGEMLLEKPLFPGTSTINQVERIMATLPPPTPEDIASVSAGYGSNLLEKTPNIPRRPLEQLFTNISDTALDLLKRLIIFNPNNRLTAVQALEHPYVAAFHHRAREPERGANVIPPLRDDVQLSIDEYRNKLYAMMDEKHKKHKNMSKARIRRLSEHIRKDTNNAGQGDAPAKKNLHFPIDDIRKEKERNELFRHPDMRSNERNVISQYANNLINGNFRNAPPSQAKSCQCLSQQHQKFVKSQRSIQSDQIVVCGTNGKLNQQPVQQKLRRGVKQIPVLARLSLAKTPVNPMRYPLPKRPSQDSPRSQVIIANKMPNNVTKHFVNGTHSINNNISHNQVIQNYLNQTMPMVTRSAVQRNCTTSSCNKATRSQALKSHLRQKPTSTITSSTSGATNTTTMKNYRSIISHNQSHGIITASAYKELKNGNR